jgi:hypothetical protein
MVSTTHPCCSKGRPRADLVVVVAQPSDRPDMRVRLITVALGKDQPPAPLSNGQPARSCRALRRAPNTSTGQLPGATARRDYDRPLVRPRVARSVPFVS